MLKMKARKVRRKCSVRGCRNTECYAISRTREIGGTVIICKKCLKDALNVVQPPSDTEMAANGENTTAEEVAVEDAEKTVFACPKCGKEYKTEQGVQKHLQNCTGGDRE